MKDTLDNWKYIYIPFLLELTALFVFRHYIVSILISLVVGFVGFSLVITGVQHIRGSKYKAIGKMLLGSIVLIVACKLLVGMAGLFPIAIPYVIAFGLALDTYTNRLMIRNCVLVKCKGNGIEAVIPKGVTRIEGKAFKNTTRLLRVTIPDGVKAIEPETFYGCRSLKTVTIPYGVVRIEKSAFENCTELTSIILPSGIVEIHPSVFANCPKLTVICPEDSYAHQYCLQNNLTFLFDYQFEAFHGLLPPGYEKLASPFLADEEKPYIFISYSHKDRDTVLPIIKELYESGWKIWYDEGLTIGDRYDETLETRVRECTAFLLFVSKNSMNSRYCLEKEIPWAIDSGKQIIKCILDRGKEIDTSGGSVIATVDSSEIEPALEAVSGLIKGEKRVAKGITVVVNPAERERVSGDGIAYCLYASKNSVAARAILLEARNGGCNFYDAPKQGTDEDLLKRSACLVVFLDKAFLADRQLTGKLIEAYRSGRDTAICQLEPIRDEDLPQKLVGLHKMQWLNFAYGINADASTKLVRHLEKRGCRNTAVLPGFKYEKTDKGIVITRYTGRDPEPRIESSYGGTPVTEIAENAFASCAHLKTIVIPENVTRIGKGAFNGCGNLISATLPDNLAEIGDGLFGNCIGLKSVVLPDGLAWIANGAFEGCGKLTSINIPDTVTRIGDSAFKDCGSLKSVVIPQGVKEIGPCAFKGCERMESVTLPDGLTRIGDRAFVDCGSLRSVVIPQGVKEIESEAFWNCEHLKKVLLPDGLTCIGASAFFRCCNLESINIPDTVTEIGSAAFGGCEKLASIHIPDGVTYIGAEAFRGCGKLASINIPDTVIVLESHAFDCCVKLTSINIPGTVTRISDSAFKYCGSLKSVVISQGVKEIEPCAFMGCERMERVSLPDGLASIGDSAFEGCKKLASIDIPIQVEKIGKRAFALCSFIQSITIPESVKEIGEEAFFDSSKKLVVTCMPGSCAWEFCQKNKIQTKDGSSA